MNVKLLTEQHLESLSLKEAAQACLILHMSKCNIVGNHMSRLVRHWSQFMRFGTYHMGLDARNPVVGVSDKVRFKLACSATATS